MRIGLVLEIPSSRKIDGDGDVCVPRIRIPDRILSSSRGLKTELQEYPFIVRMHIHYNQQFYFVRTGE